MFLIRWKFLRWPVIWLYYVSITCFSGAVLGVLTHVLFAVLFRNGPDYAYYASLGFVHGLHYAGVWAGGLALVLVVMRARREYLEAHGAECSADTTGGS